MMNRYASRFLGEQEGERVRSSIRPSEWNRSLRELDANIAQRGT